MYISFRITDDAPGLFRAPHSHNPAAIRISRSFAPLLCSYWGRSLSHKITPVQARRVFRLMTLIYDKYRQFCEKDGLIFIYDLYDWQRGILEALPISTYNGFYAKSDREYTKGMRKNRYFDEIVRSGISDFHGSFREESRENGR